MGTHDIAIASDVEEPEAGALHLTVAIPALNEERTIASVIQSIPERIPGVGRVTVLVVDDGSRDRTAQKAVSAEAHLIRHGKNLGLGVAFKSALAYTIDTGSDLMVTLDADGQFDPGDIPDVIKPVVSGEADFATASRFLVPDMTPTMPRIRWFGNILMSYLISLLTGQRFYDVSCGMRCYGRRAATSLYLTAGYTYTQEVFLNLAFQGLRIAEVPVRVRSRSCGRSRVASNLFRYGYQTLKIIFRCYRDHKPLKMFSLLAAILTMPAGALGAFVLAHYFETGAFSPHKWAAVVAISLSLLALMMIHVGIIGDMLTRHRLYLEELLYRDRNKSRRSRR